MQHSRACHKYYFHSKCSGVLHSSLSTVQIFTATTSFAASMESNNPNFLHVSNVRKNLYLVTPTQELPLDGTDSPYSYFSENINLDLSRSKVNCHLFILFLESSFVNPHLSSRSCHTPQLASQFFVDSNKLFIG